MALADDVKLRYSTQFLVELTNPDEPETNTVDSNNLSYAITAAESRFKKIVGKTYDNTDTDHQTAIFETVIVVLMERAGRRFGDLLKDRKAQNEADLESLAKITARDRIEPKSSSEVTTSSEDTEGVTDRPYFDNQRFADITTDDPPSIDD